MLLGFGLEQGPHEVGGRLPVSLPFSLHSAKAHSFILRNWMGFLFVCFVGVFCVVCFLGFFMMLLYSRYD